MEPRGRRRASSSSVFGCLTESPLMLNVMLPGQPVPVAGFVRTEKMNINVRQSENCGREREVFSLKATTADIWICLIGSVREGLMLQQRHALLTCKVLVTPYFPV